MEDQKTLWTLQRLERYCGESYSVNLIIPPKATYPYQDSLYLIFMGWIMKDVLPYIVEEYPGIENLPFEEKAWEDWVWQEFGETVKRGQSFLRFCWHDSSISDRPDWQTLWFESFLFILPDRQRIKQTIRAIQSIFSIEDEYDQRGESIIRDRKTGQAYYYWQKHNNLWRYLHKEKYKKRQAKNR